MNNAWRRSKLYWMNTKSIKMICCSHFHFVFPRFFIYMYWFWKMVNRTTHWGMFLLHMATLTYILVWDTAPSNWNLVGKLFKELLRFCVLGFGFLGIRMNNLCIVSYVDVVWDLEIEIDFFSLWLVCIWSEENVLSEIEVLLEMVFFLRLILILHLINSHSLSIGIDKNKITLLQKALFFIFTWNKSMSRLSRSRIQQLLTFLIMF